MPSSELKKQFLSELRAVSQSYSLQDIFRDSVRCMAISLASPVLPKTDHDRVESEYMTYVEKYGNTGMDHIAAAFRCVVEALEFRREDFLGHIMEEIGAANTRGTDQYLTPDSVARVMARCTMPGHPEHGKILTLNDPTAGAGALLIESAEEFILNGGRQGDVLLSAQDLDYNAFNICYVQLSLLGYPAVVTWQDTLSMEVYEGPWYTVGYFEHGFPMRTLGANPSQKSPSQSDSDVEPEKTTDLSTCQEQNKPGDSEPNLTSEPARPAEIQMELGL